MVAKKSLKRKAEPEEEQNNSDSEELESDSDAEEQDEEESSDEMESQDLAASDTESSDDEDQNDSDDAETKPEVKKDPRLEKLINKYRECQGKQLYIRLPHKLPEDDAELNAKIKAMSALVIKVHRPRQKHARFCLVDFASQKDRDAALKKMTKANENEDKLKKVLVSLPRTEDEEFVNNLVKRKEKSLENKRAKLRLKRQKKKQSTNQKIFTSSIIIANLPRTATVSEIRGLFPNAVDIQIKPRKGKAVDTTIATVNLPTTIDASKATKQKLSLAGTELVIKFSNDIKKKKSIKNTNKKNPKKNTSNKAPPAKFSKVLK